MNKIIYDIMKAETGIRNLGEISNEVEKTEIGTEQEAAMSLEEAERFFEERPELIEEVKKVYSAGLRSAFENDLEYLSFSHLRRVDEYFEDLGDDLLIRRFQDFISGSPFLDNKRTSDRQDILSEHEKDRSLAEVVIGTNKIGIMTSAVYSVSKEEAKRYYHEGPNKPFSSPAEIKFHGLYFWRRGKNRMPFSEAVKNSQYADVKVNKKSIDLLIEDTNLPPVECKSAIDELSMIGAELDLDVKEIEKLAEAFRDFATYIKPEPKTGDQCFREIGKCFSAPYTFQDFCKKWMGVEVDVDHYSESYGGNPTFYHQVNLYREKIVVDWTARQYPQFDNQPYPFVYRVGDSRIPKSWGPLKKLEMKIEQENL